MCIFVHGFFCEAYGLGFSFVWDFKDLADYVAPGSGDVLGDFIVVEFRVEHFVGIGKEPSVHEAAVYLSFSKFVEQSGLNGAYDSNAGVVDVDGFTGYTVDDDVAACEELGPHLFVVAVAVLVEAFDESNEFIYIDG